MSRKRLWRDEYIINEDTGIGTDINEIIALVKSKSTLVENIELPFSLPIGYLLHERFRIEKVSGRGGTAITYRVYDINLNR